jgi:hypothetical protein
MTPIVSGVQPAVRELRRPTVSRVKPAFDGVKLTV